MNKKFKKTIINTFVIATFGKAQYSFYYYGNDPDLDAYATIQSNWA